MRTDNLKNNKSNVRDPRGESLDQRILRLQSFMILTLQPVQNLQEETLMQ